MSSNHVEAFFVLLFSVLFCFVSVLFIVRTHRSRDATTIAKKYNSRFEEQCYQINIRKNYMVWLSFGLPNAKNCSKLRTVKIADHDCLLTVAYNLKTCRTMKLASDQSLTNEAIMLAPHWINLSHLIYSSVPQALACYSVQEAFTKSLSPTKLKRYKCTVNKLVDQVHYDHVFLMNAVLLPRLKRIKILILRGKFCAADYACCEVFFLSVARRSSKRFSMNCTRHQFCETFKQQTSE